MAKNYTKKKMKRPMRNAQTGAGKRENCVLFCENENVFKVKLYLI